MLRSRFGLRTALAFVAIVGVGLGLFGQRWQHARRQAAGRAEVARLGGVCEWDYAFEHYERYRNEEGNPPQPELPDVWATRLLGIDFTHDVVAIYDNSGPAGGSRRKPDLTDADIEQIVRLLPELRDLGIEFSALTDAGLAHLARARQLERLDLYGTKITDAGLARLAALPKLKDLNVGGTQVTIAGLNRCLQSCPLETLWLSPDQLKARADGRELLRHWPELNVQEMEQSRSGGYFRGPIDFGEPGEE